MKTIAILLCAVFSMPVWCAEYKKVAVLIFPQNETAKTVVKAAQSRMEALLMDNALDVLDQDVAEKMKLTWRQLEDPEYFVTAEDFVSNTSSQQVDAVFRVYLSAELVPTFGGFFSATAQADIRIVDAEENVKASSQLAMGSVGIPPSDGLTKQSALHNATLRATDHAMESMRFEVAALTTPNAIDFALEGPLPLNEAATWFMDRNPQAEKLMKVPEDELISETAVCSTIDPSKSLAAVGGYIANTTLGNRVTGSFGFDSARGGRGMGGSRNEQSRREFGSRLHVIDLKEHKDLKTFTMKEVGPPVSGEEGDSKPFGCAFLNNWRYLAAFTGNYLFLWDVERAVEFSRVRLPFVANEGKLGVVNSPNGTYLVVARGSESAAYKVQRKK